MNEMKPLLDDDLSANAVRVLRSAEKDIPPSADERITKIVAALSAAKNVPVPHERGHLRSVFRAGTWVALAAVLVFAGSIVRRYVANGPVASPSGVVAMTARSSDVAAAPATSPWSAPSPSREGMRVEELPNARESAAASARHEIRSSPHGSTVEDELAAIDAARAALASGNAAVALARVEDCRRRFQKSRFSEEADTLEVQALAAIGRREEARAKAEQFLSSRPRSPYEQRVRSAMTIDTVKP